MKTSWFTFGFDHVHSSGGVTFDKDIVVRIEAEDPRAVMFEMFGRKWAMEYDTEPDLAYYPRGVFTLSPPGTKAESSKELFLRQIGDGKEVTELTNKIVAVMRDHGENGASPTMAATACGFALGQAVAILAKNQPDGVDEKMLRGMLLVVKIGAEAGWNKQIKGEA